MNIEELEILKGLAKSDALLSEEDVKNIAYPLKPYTQKHPPSYVMAVATQAVLKARPIIIKEEQARMTKALRELHKKGWTLADVIEGEDIMGE